MGRHRPLWDHVRADGMRRGPRIGLCSPCGAAVDWARRAVPGRCGWTQRDGAGRASFTARRIHDDAERSSAAATVLICPGMVVPDNPEGSLLQRLPGFSRSSTGLIAQRGSCRLRAQRAQRDGAAVPALGALSAAMDLLVRSAMLRARRRLLQQALGWRGWGQRSVIEVWDGAQVGEPAAHGWVADVEHASVWRGDGAGSQQSAPVGVDVRRALAESRCQRGDVHGTVVGGDAVQHVSVCGRERRPQGHEQHVGEGLVGFEDALVHVVDGEVLGAVDAAAVRPWRQVSNSARDSAGGQHLVDDVHAGRTQPVARSASSVAMRSSAASSSPDSTHSMSTALAGSRRVAAVSMYIVGSIAAAD